MYDTVAVALDALEDPYAFERVATSVLLDEFPHLEWTGGRRDLGRDAVEVDGLLGDVHLIVQYSIAERWKDKLRRELRRYETDPQMPRRYVFVSSQQTYEADREALVREARDDYGVHLAIKGRGWLEPRLEGPHRYVAEERLQVRPRAPARFYTREAYQELLRSPGFTAPLVGVSDRVDRLGEVLTDADPRCVIVVGPGGIGKTRIALESVPDGMQTYVLARATDLDREALADLPAGIDAVLIVDNAHRVDDVRGVRHLLDDKRWNGYRIVMTIRSGHESHVSQSAQLEEAEVLALSLGPLGAAHVDSILRNPPHGIQREDIRLGIRQLSGGVPLIAHLAADGVRRGSLDRTGVAGLLRSYVRRCLEASSPLEQDILAALAVVGTLTRDQVAGLASHLERGRREVRSALEDLADTGLVENDGHSYSVTPDAIRPVIVADEYLTSGVDGHEEYLAVVRLLASNRTTVLEGLAEAVSLLDGEGASVLRHIVADETPADSESSATAWTDALREVPAYAGALPVEAADLVRRFSANWPLEPDEGLFGPVDPSRALEAAADAATAVARADLGLSVKLMVQLSELESADGRSSVEILHQRLRRIVVDVVPERPDRTTSRGVEVVRNLRAMIDPEPSPPGAYAMTRCALRLMSAEFEFSRSSVEQEAAITWGRVPAPDTAEHRRLVRTAAELVAELVPYLDDGGLLHLIGAVSDLRRAFRRIRDHLQDEARARRLRRSVDEAARTITRALLLRWESLPLAARYRLAATQPHSSLVRDCVRGDLDVQRLLALFGNERGRLNWRRQEHQSVVAGRELAHALGPDGGIEWAIRVLPQIDGHTTSRTGASAMLEELGALHDLETAAGAARWLASNSHTVWYVGPFLRGFAQVNEADADAVVMDVAQERHVGPHLGGVLDHVSDEAELAIIDILLGHRDISVDLEVARHVDRCARLDPDVRVDRLLEVVERADGRGLAQALLECIDHFQHIDFDRFVQHVRRLMLEPRDADTDGSADLVYRALAAQDVDAFMGLVRDRVQAVVENQLEIDGSTNAVPRAVTSTLAELDESERAKAMARTVELLEAIAPHPEAWRAEEELWELLRGLGPEDPAYIELLKAWAQQGHDGVDRAIRGLEGLGQTDHFLETMRYLVGLGLTTGQQDRLLRAGDPTWHGTVDTGAAREMAAQIAAWENDVNPDVRTFARRGARYLKAQADAAEDRFARAIRRM